MRISDFQPMCDSYLNQSTYSLQSLPKNNRPIKSHVWIQPVLTCKHDWEWIRSLQILWSIALKLQIGKDGDKKESKYQKYIY
jgi:hypothetical protein